MLLHSSTATFELVMQAQKQQALVLDSQLKVSRYEHRSFELQGRAFTSDHVVIYNHKPSETIDESKPVQ